MVESNQSDTDKEAELDVRVYQDSLSKGSNPRNENIPTAWVATLVENLVFTWWNEPRIREI